VNAARANRPPIAERSAERIDRIQRVGFVGEKTELIDAIAIGGRVAIATGAVLEKVFVRAVVFELLETAGDTVGQGAIIEGFGFAGADSPLIEAAQRGNGHRTVGNPKIVPAGVAADKFVGRVGHASDEDTDGTGDVPTLLKPVAGGDGAAES